MKYLSDQLVELFRLGCAACLLTVCTNWILVPYTCAQRITLEVSTSQKTIVGCPVAWDDYQCILLRRDGRMFQLSLDHVTNFERQSDFFSPYSASKIQAHLQKLFNDNYEVSRTAHYVVVHPRGKRSSWAEPFEQLYGRFSHYFSARGFWQTAPEFPLVVVVLRTQSEFNAVASKSDITNPNQYVGFYSPISNWVVTYEQQSGNGAAQSRANRLTLIHEALHQYAFNRGIHNRWSPTPKWCAEGLALMFETRGVNHSMKYTSRKDRWHRNYLPYLQAYFAQKKSAGILKTMVASDRLFSRSPDLAYAMAWGISFYLAETQTGDFNRFLQRVARRSELANYTPDDRLADFARHFGNDFGRLESQMRRFVLKQK